MNEGAAYEVRFCKVSERAELVEFIRESWSTSHIYVRDPSFLDWNHLQKNRYNFVVAVHQETGKFHGMLGFVSPGFFSTGEVQTSERIWLVLWKVEARLAEDKILGSRLLQFARKSFSSNTIVAIGITPQVAALYLRMRFQVFSLEHYFYLNRASTKFQIATINREDFRLGLSACPDSTDSNVDFREVSFEEASRFRGVLERDSSDKDVEYVAQRFGRHPRYQYRLYGIYENSEPTAVFVARKVEANGSACLRIVDFFGFESVSSSLVSSFQRLLSSEDCEYVDIIGLGFDEEQLISWGFAKCTESIFVPHLFEPFEPLKHEVTAAILGEQKVQIGKGDGDLDRPS